MSKLVPHELSNGETTEILILDPHGPDEPVCGAQYERPGGRERGDRIVECDRAAGHIGCHQETDTGSSWFEERT